MAGEPLTVEATSPAPRVLIVDDQEDNREVLRLRLEAHGFLTETAAGGAEALACVAADPPDVILLDVMMPGLDGFEVARRIKADPSLPFIPIIMQTALDSERAAVDGLAAGADEYVTKPVRFAELEARLRSMLRIKALQDAVARREQELERANSELRALVTTDALTGLATRRHIDERLREMLDHAIRLCEPLGVVLCDVDRFKDVNDTMGHAAGDEVLRQLGMLLRRSAREIDRVGRYGGEEFLAILPGAALDAAVTFAERVRQEVEAHRFTAGQTTLRCTISCGVAAWPHPRIRDRDTLLRAADDALYVAKRTGRNRVIRFDGAEFNANTKDPDDEHGAGIPVRGGTGRDQR